MPEGTEFAGRQRLRLSAFDAAAGNCASNLDASRRPAAALRTPDRILSRRAPFGFPVAASFTPTHTSGPATDHGAGLAWREVGGAAFCDSAKLPVERDRCTLLTVVALAEDLAVADVRPAAAAPRMHMVGLKEFGRLAPAAEPAVMLALSTGAAK
jgi:hypothetical protein